jgi:RNA polymerase sigma factor (TIGR02999 family)
VIRQPSDRQSGDGAEESGSVDSLFVRVYSDLKGLAHRVRGGNARGATLDTTGLVHEAYLKLSASRDVPWKDESHFFAIAARAMRQVLVELARRRLSQKRGAGQPIMMSYDDALHAAPVRPAELIALDEALQRLAAFDPRRAQVVEHRIFAGLSTEETARLLRTSTATVERDWRAARAWLTAELTRHTGAEATS